MTEQFKSFISSKCPGAEPLLIVIRGSQAYGTNLPTSDTDYSGIYIQSAEDILGFRYKDYKSYQTWLQKRNEQRWIEVESHGQKIDGKNMMHCRRLLDMSREIAQGKGIIVRRENAQELIDTRKGKVDLESLLNRAEQDVKEIDDLFKNSKLPDFVDKDFMNSLLISIRKEFYNIL